MDSVLAFFKAIANIQTDEGIVKFVAGNAVLIGLMIMFLKGLSKTTFWEWDNKLAALFDNMFSFVLPSRKPLPPVISDELPDPENKGSKK